MTPWGRHAPDGRPPKQIIKGHEMSAAGLEAPGWLPMSEKRTQVYLLYQPVVEGRVLGALTRRMATPKSWPTVVLRAEDLLLWGRRWGLQNGYS